jgi:hypothetical protein
MSVGSIFLQSAIKRLSYYKELGEKTFEQVPGPAFHYQPNEQSNSLAIIIQHLAGNMLSRWTGFLDSDGEKDWRNRDQEFEDRHLSKEDLLAYWQEGWDCCLGALRSLTEEDLERSIHIRGEELPVVDAINRQLAHYPYHVGQLIYLGKIISGENWKNLSIPKGQSEQFNRDMNTKH